MRVQVGRRQEELGGDERAPIRVDGRGPHERLLTLATVVVVLLAALLVWIVTFTPLWAGEADVRPPSAPPIAPAEAAS